MFAKQAFELVQEVLSCPKDVIPPYNVRMCACAPKSGSAFRASTRPQILTPPDRHPTVGRGLS